MEQSLPALLTKLRRLKADLRDRFGVSDVSVFGSYARGEAKSGSDLDLLVDFAPGARPTYFSLARLDAFLAVELGVKVEAIPRESLNPRIEPYIRSELVAV